MEYISFRSRLDVLRKHWSNIILKETSSDFGTISEHTVSHVYFKDGKNNENVDERLILIFKFQIQCNNNM